MKRYNPKEMKLTKYLFFTGKGGVGKTTSASSTATALADSGKKVMLVSTDPASNLQDVFEINLSNKGIDIPEVKGLTVANFDPVSAAQEYKKSILDPYDGLLPSSVLQNMEEQLSGSCTVEIAAFNEFATFLTNPEVADMYDHIIFDTAPTGHTLRMLQLPSAWNNYLDENTSGASCLGQLSGLGDKKEIYENAVKTLSNPVLTTIILVTRAQESSLIEAERAFNELNHLGFDNQILLFNGILEEGNDQISNALYTQQQNALDNISHNLSDLTGYFIPLKPFNATGVDNLRQLFTDKELTDNHIKKESVDLVYPKLNSIVENLYQTDKKVIFTMGKGGVGKTTIAATVALGLASRGKSVYLATTDPAAHLELVMSNQDNITVGHIDEKKELEKYTKEVLDTAKKTMSEEDISYVEEDLKSPCTQEIAVFRAFAELVDQSICDVVVIDTAPTGHTLLLLDSTQNYHKEIQRSNGTIPSSVSRLLPRLQDRNQTEILIVTLPENTPVYESIRLSEDLDRANIAHNWWIINNSFANSKTINPLLIAKANNEKVWIDKVAKMSRGKFAVVGWSNKKLEGEALKSLLK